MAEGGVVTGSAICEGTLQGLRIDGLRQQLF